jgi:hypothetical protein
MLLLPSCSTTAATAPSASTTQAQVQATQKLVDVISLETAIFDSLLPETFDPSTSMERVCTLAAGKISKYFALPAKNLILPDPDPKCGQFANTCTVATSCSEAVAPATGMTLNIVLNNKCTGPYGAADIQGSIHATFHVEGGKLVVDVATDSLSAGFLVGENAINIDYEARVTVAPTPVVSGTGRNAVSLDIVYEDKIRIVTYVPVFAIINANGYVHAVKNAETSCVSLEGGWNLLGDADDYELTLKGFTKCAAGCSVGGEATMTPRPKQDGGRPIPSLDAGSVAEPGSLRVSFDGSTKATYSRGTETGTFELSCIPKSNSEFPQPNIVATLVAGTYGCTGYNGCLNVTIDQDNKATMTFQMDSGEGGFACSGIAKVLANASWYPILLHCSSSKYEVDIGWHPLKDYYDLVGSVIFLQEGGYSAPLLCEPF